MRKPGAISVIVPAYNLERVIVAPLRSVLAQTSLPDEIVVVDDGSTDRTVEKIRAVQAEAPPELVRLIASPHRGPGATRNRGIEAATGEWVAFLDGDDLWLPEKIARLRAAIASDPDVGIVAHDEFEVALDGTERHKPLHRYYDPAKPLLPQLYRGCFFSTSCIAVRAAALAEAGGFDPGLPSSQDYDLWLKLARKNRLLFIPEALEKYVLREGSISSNLVLRYRCLAALAHRHAPHLALFVGPFSARLLRLRFVLAAQVTLWREWAGRGEAVKALGMLPLFCGDAARAIQRPLCPITRPGLPATIE